MRFRLPGHFNVENALAALGSALALGVDVDVAVAGLAAADPVPGRMEPIDAGQSFGVLVDYAHTPDSLENVLRAARRLTDGELICAFGCGGDRDPLEAAADGAGGLRALEPRRGHLRQPALGGPRRRSSSRSSRASRPTAASAPWSSPTGVPRSRWRSAGRSPATSS